MLFLFSGKVSKNKEGPMKVDTHIHPHAIASRS